MSSNPPHRSASCQLCPRLAVFLVNNRSKNPNWHNAPVNGYGPLNAPILLVGLAPGMRGANRTGRPFTGDYAGDLLFKTLDHFGLSKGIYRADPSDGLTLTGIRIVNAVRCVPPQNKPIASEINTCRQFLIKDMEVMKEVKVIISLGRIAHSSALKALDLREKDYTFGHCKKYKLPGGRLLISSYHCSRYNVQTGRLTEAMFFDVFENAVKTLEH